MKVLKTIIALLFPFIVFGQLSVGSDQTICLNDTAQIIATISGPGTSGCSGVSDSLACPIPGGNGQAGTAFNIVNTTGSAMTITGLSQGPASGGSGATGVPMKVYYVPDDYLNHTLTADSVNWILCGSDTVTLTSGAATGYIALNSVSIPAGATYGFYMSIVPSTTPLPLPTPVPASVQYTNGTGTAGVTTWAQDANIIVTEGHGVQWPFNFNFSPRAWNGTVHYGGGSAWYDVNSGQIIGSGDTLHYSPSQTTDIAAVLDCNGQTYTDTMHLEVLNTTISSTGLSLCNGPLVLTAPSGYSSYLWNGPSTSSILTVNQAGSYYVNCTTANGQSCQSDPITIYNNIIPVTLSTPDSVFICQGDTVFMDGPSGFSQYNWNTGATTQSINTTTTGNYDLTVTDGNGCTGVSGTTTVSISPQAISLSATGYSLCNGPVTLDAGPGYANYMWNNGFNTQTITVNGAGTYYVTVTYPTGCTAMSDTVTIYSATTQFYFNIETIGEDSLCLPGGQITLNAGNFSSYNWNTGATTQQITVNNLGAYYVNVTDSNGCQGVSNPPFQVANVVNTSSINGNAMPTQFQLETYSVSSNTGSTYNWGSDGIIQSSSGASANIYWTNYGAGLVYVIETDADGCVGDTISLPISIIVSSISEINKIDKIKKITDVLGREVKPIKNIPLFYIHENGKVEKRIIIE